MKRARLTRLAWLAMATIALVAVFADFLASDLPIACHVHGHTYLFPNVMHPAALEGEDCARLRSGEGPGDWTLNPPLVAFGPREGSADDGAPRVAPPWTAPGHPLGTDQEGRDVFARLVHGARTSLGTGLLAAFVFVGLGSVLGALAGFYGGFVDALVGRAIETLTPFPTLILVLVVQALLPHPTIESMPARHRPHALDGGRAHRPGRGPAHHVTGLRAGRPGARRSPPTDPAAAHRPQRGRPGARDGRVRDRAGGAHRIVARVPAGWGGIIRLLGRNAQRGPRAPRGVLVAAIPGARDLRGRRRSDLVGEAWRDALDPRLAHLARATTRLPSLEAPLPRSVD